METVESWLDSASKKLKLAEIASAKLDTELILARVLKVERTTIHAFPHRKLTKQQIFHANNWLNQRSKRVPLAYILGEKEFFGRNFKITTAVLTPRPETETIIELYKKFAHDKKTVLEIGTGSGIIAITAKLENPSAEVFASDISSKALDLARDNAINLGAKVHFYESNLLEKIPTEITQKTDVIIANLPYVNREWIDFSAKNELHHEPEIALFAEDGGLALIKKLIQQTEICPNLNFLILEADPDQLAEIEHFANRFSFTKIESQGYAIVLQK